MSDEKFNEEVERAVEKRLDGFAVNLQKQITDTFQKDYANTWLKANDLMRGGPSEDISKPAAQSYLVYKCVTVIANNFPQAPFVLYGPNDEPLDKTDQLYKLLKNPNDTMSGFDLWSATSTFYNLYGEAYWYLVQSVGQSMGTSRMPAEIIVLDPKKMADVVDPNTGMLLGWMYDGRISLQLEEVLQFKNTNPYNRYRGLSPLDAVNIEIKADYKAGVYQKKFFDNDAKPGMVLQVDKEDNSTVEELKKLVRMWEQGHKGVGNAHKVGILRGGMSLVPVGLSQQEMDFINSRAFTRDIVLSVFGVPKTLAGFTEGINRATADTQKRIFWQETLKPQMLRMQERLNARLVNSAMPGSYGKFDFSRIDELKQSMDEDVKNAQTLFNMGFSRNELNERFHLGFEEDSAGDTKYIPMNLIDVESANMSSEPEKQFVQETIQKNEKQARMERQRSIFMRKQQVNERKLLGKVKKYFITQRTKVLKNLFQKAEVSTSELISRINIIEKEDERLIASLTPVFQDIMQDAGEMALDFMALQADYQIDSAALFNRVNRVKDINKTIFNQLKMQISEGVEAGESLNDISKRIKQVYKFADKRAMTIARTESSSLMSETSLNVYKNNGVLYKEWLTAGDDEVRPEHEANMNQGPVKVSVAFQNGEMFPGDQSVNCRCTISPVVTL